MATHTLPIRNFRGRGRLWESVSFAVLCPQNSLAANNCHLWAFFYSSHPMLLRFDRKSEIYNKRGGRKRPGPTPRNDVWGGQHRWKLSSRPVAIERDRGITDGMLRLKIHWGGIYDRKNFFTSIAPWFGQRNRRVEKCRECNSVSGRAAALLFT